MADYVLPGVVEKRVRYFDGQFLQDQDFIDEQDYQLDREHRHNRLLHGPGIAEGLTISSAAPNQVTVAPGTAIDSDGNQLVLAQATTVDLAAADFNDIQGIALYISFLASAEDQQTGGGSVDFTRWLERPQLTALAPGNSYSGAAPPVLLANVALDGAGRVTVDSTVRSYSGLLLPGPGADPAALHATSGGAVDLTAGLSVEGSLGVGTTSPGAKLEVVGSGGASVDFVVNGRMRSDNNDGGLWIASDRFVGGFDTSKIGFWNGNTWQLAVQNDGKVGIGTTQPAATLHVGAYPSPAPITALQVDVESFLTPGNAQASYFLNVRDLSAGPATHFCVRGDGTVGVGTASPAAKLEVVGTGGWSVDFVVNGRMRSDNDEGGLWIASDRFVGGFDTSKIGFWNGNTWQLAVQSDGKVGIGTTQPAATLHVGAASSPAPITALQVDVASFLTPGNAQASYFLNVRDLSAGPATHFCVRGDGAVGVGTATPSAKLQVVGGGGASVDLVVNGRLRSDNNDGGLWVMEDRFVGGYGSGNIGFWNNGQWWLTVNTNGTVGIGTADTGGQSLCVAGSAWVQGNLFVGGRFAQQTSPGLWSEIAGIYIPGLPGTPALGWEATSGPSDIRLKTDLRPVSHALDLVRKLRAVRYRWGEDGLGYLTRDIDESVSAGPGATTEQDRQARQDAHDTAREALAGDRLGLIAQDVETVLPELVHHDAGGYKHIRYQHLTAVLAEAIKEQDAVVRALAAEVAALRAEGARA